MEEKRKAEQPAVDAWDCGSPLYDSYEIASLGHVIDRHSLALPFPSGSNEEGRHVIQYSSTPRDQEKGLEVKEEGVLFKMIRVFFWKRKTTSIKGRNNPINLSRFQPSLDLGPPMK
ncbi:4-hydroxy-tetrahydrodipicolinate reductase [Salix suchowensis]|nr:4-hydroxy-tetrahydrodipicolinate reductase [Salix suchowensis]